MTDFAYFMWAEPFTLVVPRPGEEPRLFAFIWPFQSSVTIIDVLQCSITAALLPRIIAFTFFNLPFRKGLAVNIYCNIHGCIRDDPVFKNSKFIRIY